MSNDDDRVDDVIAGLDDPLWEGKDIDFAAYVHETFGVPASVEMVTISARTGSGRFAVGIADPAVGAVLFVVTPDPLTKTTHIAPTIMGPLSKNADVIRRAKASDGDANMSALTGL